MSKTYYLLRHGQTYYTKYRKGRYGLRILNAPILEDSKHELLEVAQVLKPIKTDYNVSSKILRCRQTAQIIAEETGKHFVYDGRINEFFIETIGMFKKRVTRFIQEMEASPHENILICTHAVVIAAITSLLNKGEIKASDFNNYPPPGSLTIIKDGKVISQQNFGEKN